MVAIFRISFSGVFSFVDKCWPCGVPPKLSKETFSACKGGAVRFIVTDAQQFQSMEVKAFSSSILMTIFLVNLRGVSELVLHQVSSSMCSWKRTSGDTSKWARCHSCPKPCESTDPNQGMSSTGLILLRTPLDS